MIGKMFTVGTLLTNCYVAVCERTREAIIIDPGFDNSFEAEKIFRLINNDDLTLKLILNTHGHPDHTCGNGFVKRGFMCPF